MRLAVKTTSAVFLVLLIMLGVDGYASARREESLFRADVRHDGLLVGRAMAGLLSNVWRSGGERRALELVEEADRADDEVRIRWVWLDPHRPDHSPAVDPHLLDDLAAAGSQTIDRVDPDGMRRTYAYVPVATGGPQRGALEVSESMAGAYAYTRMTLVRQGTLAGVMALLGGVVLALVSRKLIAVPLVRMMDKARRIGRGDLADPLRSTGRDELAQLARTLDEMCDHLAEAREKTQAQTRARLAAQDQLRHAERLATVGRLSAGLAHELGTPLNVVTGRAQLISGAPSVSAEVRGCADVIEEQAKRMTAIIRGLLDFARRDPPVKAFTDLESLARGVLDLLRSTAGPSGVTLHLTVDDDVPPAWVDRSQIEQVLLNLLMNGIQSVEGTGTVTVALSTGWAEGPAPSADTSCTRCITIDVVDTGCGIGADQFPHIFDPFFTTKEVGKGTGLGLSIAYGIVQEHGGRIDAASTPGQGSRFTIYLPAAPAPDHQPARTPSQEGLAGLESAAGRVRSSDLPKLTQTKEPHDEPHDDHHA